MYLHKTKNGHCTPPCCYFSGELEVVECLPQTFSGGMMVCGEAAKAVRYDSDFVWEGELWPEGAYIISEKDRNAVRLENFCGR